MRSVYGHAIDLRSLRVDDRKAVKAHPLNSLFERVQIGTRRPGDETRQSSPTKLCPHAGLNYGQILLLDKLLWRRRIITIVIDGDPGRRAYSEQDHRRYN